MPHLCRRMKKHIFGKFKKAKGESSSQGSHHAHGREEEEGYHGMVPYEPPSRMREPESGLMLSQEELQRYYIIREGLFLHTSIIDPDLLARTGMDVELDKVFRAIGWSSFWQVPEFGKELLAKEFLCTLKLTNNGISFRMCEQEHQLNWSLLNTALGCEHECELDLDHATRMFDKIRFWKAISGSNDCSNPTPIEIHNPTLRFLNFWIMCTLYPGMGTDTLIDDELKILYAMVSKIKVSPVKLLVNYWLNSIEYGKPIYFTSFITRIADTFGLLESHYFEDIGYVRGVVDENFFINANMLIRDPNGELKMIYPGYTTEIPLPCARRRLYGVRTLTIRLARVASPDVAGTRRVTRRMMQAAQMEQGGSSHHDVEEGDEAMSVDASDSMGLPPQRTPRPRDRARRHQPTGMDSLINDMGELQIGQEATLQLALQNGQHIRRVREEDAQRWAGWYQNFPPPQ